MALDPALRARLYGVLRVPHGERDVGVFRPADRTWVNYDLAVLDALTRAPDTTALRDVKALAEWTLRGAFGDRARACRDSLEAVATEEKRVASLLRPSEAPGADKLLRPAAEAPEVPPEALLRPAEGTDE